jgi:hypothetical protein
MVARSNAGPREDGDVLDPVEATDPSNDDEVAVEEPDADPFDDDFEPPVAGDDLEDDVDDEADDLDEDGVDEVEASVDELADDVADEEGTGGSVVLPAEAEFDDDEDEGIVAVVTGDDDEDDAGEIEGLRDGEFVCRSCYLAKRETQLADADRLLCRDCA